MNLEKKKMYFLSNFRKPKSQSWVDKNFFVREALKISGSKFVKELSQLGLVKHPDLQEAVDAEYTVIKLKEIATKLKISVSGKKEQIVKTLVESSPASFKSLTSEYYQLTSNGENVVSAFLDEEEKVQADYDEKIMVALAANSYGDAVDHFQKSLSYFSYQHVDTGISIPRDLSEDKMIVKHLLNNSPRIFKSAEASKLAELRRVGAFAWLRGEEAAARYLASDFSILPQLDVGTTLRMVIFFGYFLRDRQKHIKAGVKKIELLCVDDGRTCESCKKVSGKVYDLKSAPELPHEDCTGVMGCRCTYVLHSF